ncbi:MAG: VOC family protein [Nannocystales bacterium]
MQLSYVIIYVPDVTKAVSFYEGAFGLTQRMIHDSGQYAEMETGSTALAFASEADVTTCHTFRPNRADEKAAAVEVAFVTEDVQAAFDRAVDHGAHPEVAPVAKPWGQTIAYVRDLNGFLVELCTRVGS